MPTIPASMQTALNGRATTHCHCWTLSRDIPAGRAQAGISAFYGLEWDPATLAGDHDGDISQIALRPNNLWRKWFNSLPGFAVPNLNGLIVDGLGVLECIPQTDQYHVVFDLDLADVALGSVITCTWKMQTIDSYAPSTIRANVFANVYVYTQVNLNNLEPDGHYYDDALIQRPSYISDTTTGEGVVDTFTLTYTHNNPAYLYVRFTIRAPGRSNPLLGGRTFVSEPTVSVNTWATPASTEVLGFTDHDQDVTLNGVVCKASTGFDPSAIKRSMQLEVDDHDVIGLLDDDRISAADIASGRYDNSIVTVYRVNWQDPDNDNFILARGPIGEVSRGRQGFKAEVMGMSAFADQTIGRTYSPKCQAEFGDSECKVNMTGRTFEGFVLGLSNSTTFTAITKDGSLAAHKYTDGYLTWLTGANAGSRFRIRSHLIDGVYSTLITHKASMKPISLYDVFSVTQGCPKTAAFCASIGNINNYRGFNLKPPRDAILNYARKEGKNDGGSLFS